MLPPLLVCLACSSAVMFALAFSFSLAAASSSTHGSG